MKQCGVRVMLYASVFGLMALLVLPGSASADFRGAYGPESWSADVLEGPLTVGIDPATGPTPLLECSYTSFDFPPYTTRTGEFSAVATRTGTILLDWEYFFAHCWYQVYADLWVYADGPSGWTEQHLVEFYNWGYTGCRTFTGSASLDVTEGYEFGLIVGGRHFDATNCLQGTVTISNFHFPVLIDIKPGEYPNAFNANGHGVVPIAVLGSADLDVTEIDPSTLSFEGAAVRVKGNGAPQCSLEDVSGPLGVPDGYADLVCQFVDDFADGSLLGRVSATVTGNLWDGAPIAGSDSIVIVP